MKNTIGTQISCTIFGESHGSAIGITLDGLPAGIALDLDFIRSQMEKRKAKGRISTQRHETDEFHIISGLFEGYTTGSPLTILIQNQAQHSQDYEKTKHRLRPSHADYTADEKYFGFQDYRGGGHFSGRITAPLVAAGAIALQILQEKGILIGSHIERCHGIKDVSFAKDPASLTSQISSLSTKEFPVISEESSILMKQEMEAAAEQGDSVGGILESAIVGLPTGIGEPFFDSMESVLAHYLYSVPAVKGVSFGLGFGFGELYGSEANDAIQCIDGTVSTKTNHNSGINGGISNGMPVIIHTCIKPTPSIYKEQNTIHKLTHEAETLVIQGRHDPAIIHRAAVVVDSVLALGVLDLYMEREAVIALQGKRKEECL